MRKLFIALALVLALLLLTHATTGTALAAGPSYVVVQPGQTLFSIASSYGLSTWAVANANGIWNPNLIYAGQVLVIPNYGMYGGYAGSNYYGQYYPGYYQQPYYPHPTYNCYYWVRYGDTMYSIARMYGGNMWTIASANGLYNPNWIYAGQRLLIPGCN